MEVADKKKSTDELDDPEFLERLKKGDEKAFAILIQIMKDRVYNLALRLTRNSDDAEEVAQETFLAIFDKIGTFQGRSRLSTWIFSIAYNAALSKLKKNGNYTVTFDDESALMFDASWMRNRDARFDMESERPVMQKEMQEQLDTAIQTLPSGYREIFIMKEIEQMSIKEVAEIFGINPGAVKTRLHRARLYLRARLSDYWNTIQP